MNKTLIFIFIALVLGIGVFYLYNTSEVEEPLSEDYYISGEIYSILENRVLVAEDGSGKDLEGDAIWVTVEDETDILDYEENSVQFEDLRTGMKVEVWTEGVVLESYPAQGTARKIVVLEEQNDLVKECFIGGCSGEICSDDPEAISTCELLAGMECLEKDMSCQLVDSQCTWVLSQEAAQCFLQVENEYGEKVRNTRIGYLFEKAEKKQ